MHHTHTTTPALASKDVPDLLSKLRASAYSTRVLPSLLTRWSSCGLLFLAVQFALAMAPARSDDTPGTGSLILHLPDRDVDALVLDADISVQIQGLLADMTLVQAFRNTTDQWVEGRYRFPLPPDATVRGLRMRVGDRTIKGEIQPREEANAVYGIARDSGQIASLEEQQRPNLFTMNLANIAPGETIIVTLDAMLAVKVIDQQLLLSLPTTLTPRYTNAVTPDVQALGSSFVQADDARGPRLDVKQQQVANLIPKGNQMMRISMPQGAAGVDTLGILSLLLGISSLALLSLSRLWNH